jgi:hypothetical protein
MKYLSKEDLESLGWKRNRLPYQFEKDLFLLYIANGDDFENVGLNYEIVILNKRYEETIFRGSIPTIEDFSYICKLLHI